MVIRILILLFLSAFIVACSNVQKQSVVAVEDRGTGEMAKAELAKTVSSTPKAVKSLLDKAERAIENDETEAFKLLSQSQRLAPNEPLVYLLFGKLYLQQDQLNKAEAMFRKTVAFDSSDTKNKALDFLKEIAR